jgi:hypothetical protein
MRKHKAVKFMMSMPYPYFKKLEARRGFIPRSAFILGKVFKVGKHG